MRAFHNDAHIKETYLRRVQQHRAANELTHDTEESWSHGRGDAVGCTIHSDDLSAYEDKLGIPVVLAFLESLLFEKLPNEQSMEWPEAFLASIPVGADLSHVIDQYLIWLLVDEEAGVMCLEGEQGQAAIKQVAALYERRLAGEDPTADEWIAARNAVRAAVPLGHVYAVVVAAAAADTSTSPKTCIIATLAAAHAIARAATGTGDDDAFNNARSVHFARIAEKVLELLGRAPISEEE